MNEARDLQEVLHMTANQMVESLQTKELSGYLSDKPILKKHDLHEEKTLSTTWLGKAAAPGLAMGQVVISYNPNDLESVPYFLIEDKDKETEWLKFNDALNKTKHDLLQIKQRWVAKLPDAEMTLFDAYLQILDSHHIAQSVKLLIDKRYWAPWALKKTIGRLIRKFQAIEEEYLSERAHDFVDLGRRILTHLQHQEGLIKHYPNDTILVGEEISAACLAEVPHHKLKGVVSVKGSVNSHLIIFAKALGIPAVIGVKGLPLSKLNAQMMAIDGLQGEVYVHPSHHLIQDFNQHVSEHNAKSVDLDKLSLLPTKTLDNRKIDLKMNLELNSDMHLALNCHSDGIGLYRTELHFMLKDRFPREEEQTLIYEQLLKTFSNKPVVIRILDIGGDKFLPYFPMDEKNAFLGWRGIRVMLDHPDIFLQQLRALLKASVGLTNLHILLPMITQVSEIDESHVFIQQAYEELKEEGYDIIYPKIGAMIETPSAVFCVEDIAQKVDFLSVGTNDLTQYILAADRNNQKLANLYDSFHLSVLWALEHIALHAKKAGKPVSLCGDMASYPITLIILLALEFDSLSVYPSVLAKLKWLIRHLSIQQAKKWYHAAKIFNKGSTVKQYLEKVLKEANLDRVQTPRVPV